LKRKQEEHKKIGRPSYMIQGAGKRELGEKCVSRAARGHWDHDEEGKISFIADGGAASSPRKDSEAQLSKKEDPTGKGGGNQGITYQKVKRASRKGKKGTSTSEI